MSLRLKEKILALLTLSIFVLLASGLAAGLGSIEKEVEKEVDYYVHCVDGHCTPIPADQIKVIYK